MGSTAAPLHLKHPGECARERGAVPVLQLRRELSGALEWRGAGLPERGVLHQTPLNLMRLGKVRRKAVPGRFYVTDGVGRVTGGGSRGHLIPCT